MSNHILPIVTIGVGPLATILHLYHAIWTSQSLPKVTKATRYLAAFSPPHVHHGVKHILIDMWDVTSAQ